MKSVQCARSRGPERRLFPGLCSCLVPPRRHHPLVGGLDLPRALFRFLCGHYPVVAEVQPRFGTGTDRLASRDQKGWDKIFFPLMLLVSLAWLVLSAMDAVRFRWSHVVPWLQVTGGVILLSSFFLLFSDVQGKLLSVACRPDTAGSGTQGCFDGPLPPRSPSHVCGIRAIYGRNIPVARFLVRGHPRHRICAPGGATRRGGRAHLGQGASGLRGIHGTGSIQDGPVCLVGQLPPTRTRLASSPPTGSVFRGRRRPAARLIFKLLSGYSSSTIVQIVMASSWPRGLGTRFLKTPSF